MRPGIDISGVPVLPQKLQQTADSAIVSCRDGDVAVEDETELPFSVVEYLPPRVARARLERHADVLRLDSGCVKLVGESEESFGVR